MHNKVGRAVFGVFSALTLSVLGYSLSLQASLPDQFYVAEGENFSLDSTLPIKARSVNILGDEQVAPVYRSAGNSYTMQLSLPGGIAVKQVKVDVVPKNYVVPSGMPFGIKMFTNGVMVVNMGDVQTSDGMRNPAKDAGILVGDIVLSINGRYVRGNNDLASIISKAKGEPLKVVLERKGEQKEVTVQPAMEEASESFKVGLWVRDSSAGIGTVTFFDTQTGVFGGLGHAVCDVDTGEILPLQSGEMVDVEITGYTKGVSGDPGELSGAFLSDEKKGDLKINSQTGLYGCLSATPEGCGEPVEVAMRQEVKQGPATIRTTIDGEGPKEYDVMIEKVDYSSGSPTKNLQVRITDKELLEKTGGIVQGMSGSPILQDGKLVGAVTHVFVDDPTRGYGIFAENMMNTASKVEKK